MKHFFTISLCFLALSLSFNAVGQMPYNPDSNGDYLIGAPDLLSFLGVYNTMLVDSSLTCDYEGTELEELFGGIFSQTLIIDSVYVEYLLIDTALTYLPGCPDPVDIEVVLERSYMFSESMDYNAGGSYIQLRKNINYLGYNRLIEFYFYFEQGLYYINISDSEVSVLTSYSGGSNSIEGFIPFPESWTLDENGVQVGWPLYCWVNNCSSFRLIPYWHEAE